jgi:hypothetical protein
MEQRIGWGNALRTLGQLLDGQAAERVEILSYPAGLVIRWASTGTQVCAEGHSWTGLHGLNERAARLRRSLAINGAHRWDRWLRSLGQDLEQTRLEPCRIETGDDGLWVECGSGEQVERRLWPFANLDEADRLRRAARVLAFR